MDRLRARHLRALGVAREKLAHEDPRRLQPRRRVVRPVPGCCESRWSSSRCARSCWAVARNSSSCADEPPLRNAISSNITASTPPMASAMMRIRCAIEAATASRCAGSFATASRTPGASSRTAQQIETAPVERF
jgi:hypothetical protein